MRIFFFLLLFGSFAAHAESRVYQLRLTDTKTNKSRVILSNLMPEQYVFYYPITPFETLKMEDHWMCWQRSDGFQKPCTRPFSGMQNSAESPAVSPAESLKTSSQSSPPGV